MIITTCIAFISIHALLAESDAICKRQIIPVKQFLSTLSLRRATREPTALRTPHQRFLSTLSLRRATSSPAIVALDTFISIHALLAESDVSSRKLPSSWRRFLSTLSLRRATAIHNTKIDKHDDFYPRSPCGERQTALRVFSS